MTRIDTPTWLCDRCGYTSTTQGEMTAVNSRGTALAESSTLIDLCPTCYNGFTTFLSNEEAVPIVAVGGPIAVAEPIEGVPETVEEV